MKQSQKVNFSEAILQSRQALAEKKARVEAKLEAKEKEAALARHRESIRLLMLAEEERRRLLQLPTLHRKLELFFDDAVASSFYVSYVKKPKLVGRSFTVAVGSKTISARALFYPSNKNLVGVSINKKCIVPFGDAIRRMSRSMANSVVMIEETLRAKGVYLLSEKTEADGFSLGEACNDPLISCSGVMFVRT